MVADDTAARKILKEDLQAEAILEDFAKGNPVPRLQDSAANQLAMKTMMSPVHRVTRALVVKGTNKKLWYIERKIIILGMHCLCLIILFHRQCFLKKS
jgi:hypothetical protein